MRWTLSIALVFMVVASFGVYALPCLDTCPDYKSCEPNPMGQGMDVFNRPHRCNPNNLTCWSYDPLQDMCQELCFYYLYWCWFNDYGMWDVCEIHWKYEQTCLQP